MTDLEESWDWELHQSQTAATVHQLLAETDVEEGAIITLDLTFLPEDGADLPAFEKVLTTFGYALGDGEEGEILASVSEVPFTFDAIWTHEERTTKMALARGFVPDGWGFWEP